MLAKRSTFKKWILELLVKFSDLHHCKSKLFFFSAKTFIKIDSTTSHRNQVFRLWEIPVTLPYLPSTRVDWKWCVRAFWYLFVYLFICLFIYLFLYLFIYLFVCLFVCLFILLFIYLFIYDNHDDNSDGIILMMFQEDLFFVPFLMH